MIPAPPHDEDADLPADDLPGAHDGVVGPDDLIRFQDGRCDTCVFHPGNLMELRAGRLAGLVRELLDNEGHLVCHETGTYHRTAPGAICAGFIEHPDADRSLAVRLIRAGFGSPQAAAPVPATAATSETWQEA